MQYIEQSIGEARGRQVMLLYKSDNDVLFCIMMFTVTTELDWSPGCFILPPNISSTLLFYPMSKTHTIVLVFRRCR